MAKRVKKKKDDTKLFAFLGVLLTVIGFVIAILVKKDNKYVMYYGKQGLILFIAWAVVSVLYIIPLIGWILAPILYVIVLIIWIIEMIYSLSGEMKPTPFIGHYADNIKV